MKNHPRIFLKINFLLLIFVSLFGLLATSSPVFNPDNQPIGYLGQPAFSHPIVDSGNEFIYIINYSASDWSGDLKAYRVSENGEISFTEESTVWSAANNIPGHNSRIIITNKRNASAASTSFSSTNNIPFRLDQLTNEQKTSLGTSTVQEQILNYVRGDKSNEIITDDAGVTTGTYRTRSSPLGDIIHSTPVFWNDGVNKTIFFGANDGMLHAVDANNGLERFAYIPSMLIPKLKDLSDPTYTHKYYVDGRMDIKKTLDNASTTLVGTLGAGGRGLFGLDVTNVANYASENTAKNALLWEISNTSPGFANLGYTYAAPSIITVPNGTSSGLQVVAVGNGYNNTNSSDNYIASLFLINPRTGALVAELKTTDTGTLDNPNGLSTPSFFDNDNDGKMDVAYAGDINGNLWKFTFTSTLTSSTVEKIYTNTSGPMQAITSAPGIVKHPSGGNMVIFATGKILASDDSTKTDTFYVYGVRDTPAGTTTWLDQTLISKTFNFTRPNAEGTSTPATASIRVSSNATPAWDTNRGWRLALPSGERVVGDGAFVYDGVFRFVSTNPTVIPTTPGLLAGDNWWMAINPLTGGSADEAQIDLNEDRETNAFDRYTETSSGVSTTYIPVGQNIGPGTRSQMSLYLAKGNAFYIANYTGGGAPTTTSETVIGNGIPNGHLDIDVSCISGWPGNCNQDESGVSYDPLYLKYRVLDYSDRGVATTNQGYIFGEQKLDSWLGYAVSNGFRMRHTHLYDDVFNVLGLNLLDPSTLGFRLRRILTAPIIDLASYSISDPIITEIGPAGLPTTVTRTNVPLYSIDTSLKPVSPASSRTTTFYTARGRWISTPDSPITTVSSNTSTTTTTMEQDVIKKVITVTKTSSSVATVRTIKTDTKIRRSETETVTAKTHANGATKKFRILLMNQAYSPAARITIQSVDGTVNIFERPVMEYQTNDSLNIADLPTFDITTLKTLKITMPNNAFSSKTWDANQVNKPSSGIIPLSPECVSHDRPSNWIAWRNGALTVQIIHESVTQSQIQKNVASNRYLGWRLTQATLNATSMDKNHAFNTLIADYSIFWHNKVQRCLGTANWNPSPALETQNENSNIFPPFGTYDPGSWVTGSLPLIPGTTTGTDTDGTAWVQTITITTNSEGIQIATIVTTRTPPGSGVSAGGVVNATGATVGGSIQGTYNKSGRISWREVTP
jgi:type IV pilus assembly protein PilY1